MENAPLRRAALCLFQAMLFLGLQFSGHAAATVPAPVERAAITVPAPPPAGRGSSSLFRFVGEAPRIRLQAKPPPAVHPRRSFERFTANVALFRLVNTNRAPWLDAIALVLLVLGSGWVLIPVVAYAAFFRRSVLPVLLVAVAVETLLVTLLKQMCAQPRPGALLEEMFLAEGLMWRSFPSGDAAMAFTLAWVLKRGLPWPARAGFILYAVMVAYQRIYLGAHFPLDVTAGALVGIISVLLAEWLFTPKPAPAPEVVPAIPVSPVISRRHNAAKGGVLNKG